MPHSALVNEILNKHSNIIEYPIDLIRKIENGIEFNKLESKGKSEKKLFCIQLNLFRIAWVSGVRDQIEGVVNLRDIKEIRIGKQLKLLDTKCEELKKKCFTLYSGKKFRLKELSGFCEF